MIFHQDVIQLTASAEKVREFLREPERISEYYPDLIEYGTIEQGKVYWVRGEAGVALFKILEERCIDTLVAMSIVTNITVEKPYTIESIEADIFMSMIEEWDVIAKDGGSQITKTWLDLELYQMKDLPMVEIIKEAAIEEHAKIVTAWNKAAS